MPEEPEIDTEQLQETIDELREERAERAEEERKNQWIRYISLTTALLAVVAAIAALMSGDLINEALALKNESVLNQGQASDQWAYYQAKGIKANGAAQTGDLLEALGKNGQSYIAQAKRYIAEQKEIQTKAKELEAERDKAAANSEQFTTIHHIFAYCVTFTQVAIALSAVAALTRRKPVWLLSLLVGAAGIIYFGTGLAKTSAKAKPPVTTGSAAEMAGQTAAP